MSLLKKRRKNRMKKGLLFVLMALLVLPMFAEDVSAEYDPSVSVSGMGKVTFGANLDEGTVGFGNEYEAKVEVIFVPEVDPSKAGEGEIYGEIVFDNAKVAVYEEDHGTNALTLDGGIAIDYAKLVAGDAYIKIYGGPDLEINYESGIGAAVLKGADTVSFNYNNNAVSTTETGTGGFEAGYSVTDVADIFAQIVSIKDWTATENDTDADDNNKFAFKAGASVTAVENLTFEVAFNSIPEIVGTPADAIMTVGAKTAYKVDLGNDMSVEPMVGFDYLSQGDVNNYAVGNGVRLAWAGDSDTDDLGDSAVVGKVLDQGTPNNIYSGVELGFSYAGSDVDGVDPTLALNLNVVEQRVGGMIPNLGFIAGYTAEDLQADTLVHGLGLGADYQVNDDIHAYGAYRTDLTENVDSSKLFLGAEYANIFPLTSVGVDYESGNLEGDADLVPVNGVVKTWMKISY